MMPTSENHPILDIPLKRWFPANLETLLVVLLLLAAILSRFIGLGDRAVSHDEVNHVVPSYSLYSGNGYQYDPMSHGPLQFHMIALSYALFGDNDFTTRIPAAVLSVVSLALAMLAFRRYLGRTGAILAGLMFLISPLMLFYGRYARNEAYIIVWGLLTLYATLRYLETGKPWALFLFTAANALHFTDKATAYMFAGEIFLFLLAYFVDRMARREWQNPKQRTSFLLGLILAIVLFALAGGLYLTQKPLDTLVSKLMLAALAALGLAAIVWSGLLLVQSFGWAGLKAERSLNLLVLLGTLVLPMCAAIPIALLGKTPLDYTSPGVLRVIVAVVVLGGLALAIGLAWFGRKWLYHAALFFIPFVVLYSTFFTAPAGIVGGLVGLLSYWSSQQGVARGGQPFYYYAFLLIPVYEFLPALGTVAAAWIASAKKLWISQPGQPFSRPAAQPEPAVAPDGLAETDKEGLQPVPIASLFVFWSISSLALFTYAGEKMPWLTIHLAMPMILAAAWAFGWMIESIPWGRVAAWTARNYARAAVLAFFSLLAVLTARTAFKAAYINYDYPFEYLVYAHGAPYPKALFSQIEELSYRITGGTNLVVAYDNNVRYPYWWYMRHYPNKVDFDQNPTREELKDALIIEAGSENTSKLTPIVRDNYFQSNYMRLWWPTMDYWSLKWDAIATERNNALAPNGATSAKVAPMNVFGYLEYVWPHIKPFFTTPAVRNAVWQIWFNRDYTAWAALTGNNTYTLTNWGTSEQMTFYIRKDIVSKLWPYGTVPQVITPPVDPYAKITTPVTPDKVIGQAGAGAGQFQSPRGLALAADGSLYVADASNNRIQHLSASGQVLQMWGSFADISKGAAPGGTFNEPWGVAVGPDGSVYVADTWNYRIQKFTSDGKFIKMWGTGPAEGKDQFYGPRGLAVDSLGHVFVADTGNKRIVIFDANGNYLSEFGTPGAQLGQLDEPVDIAFDADGNAYVTDTWNMRIQVFTPDETRLVYTASTGWDVNGWNGNGLDNKPFITVDSSGTVSVTDPEMCRVISFSPATGQATHVWDGCSASTAFQLPIGVLSDGSGGLWVSDAANGKLVHFQTQTP
ncbi:MAG TPA: glycosyltransferase family 39 protein [Anaerolineales bacterium]|nr:glycosyltransferase family 39 protein [Anaerolineales bacterium]